MIISFLVVFLLFSKGVSSDIKNPFIQRELLLCPINFLPFSLPTLTNNTNRTASVLDSYQTTFVNFTSTFEGDDFYANSTYVDPKAIEMFDKGIKRKMNKLSIQCNFHDKKDFEEGLVTHYFHAYDSKTMVLGGCTSPNDRYISCANVTSTVTIKHDPLILESEVIAIILESCKIFMDLNIATPFYHTYIGPYLVTSKFTVTLAGVQPHVMSTSDIGMYESSLFNILREFLSNFDPPVVITKVMVLNQILNRFSGTRHLTKHNRDLEALKLKIDTQVLAYYNGPLSLKKSISDTIYNVTKERKLVDYLKSSGNSYFKDLMGANTASDENTSLDLDERQNISFYIPDLSLVNATALNEEIDKKNESTSVAMSLTLLVLFFGIIFSGFLYGRYTNRANNGIL